MGGGTKNDKWMRLVADITGKELLLMFTMDIRNSSFACGSALLYFIYSRNPDILLNQIFRNVLSGSVQTQFLQWASASTS
ncbi:hypothetical protein [Cohnella abietis]|uniref:hypothetical protein n=1 Tax=Cohnella abietis TaxID=2507935 RepID=UPI00102EBC11